MMGWLECILAVASVLAWPLCILSIALILRPKKED